MGVKSAATMGASRNRFGACTRGPAFWADLNVRVVVLPWLVRLAGLRNGRVPADGSPGRTTDGRVVCDFKLEPTAREV